VRRAISDGRPYRDSYFLVNGHIWSMEGTFRLASSPEYRLCGRSLLTAMPSAFFCPIRTSNRFPRDACVDQVALEQHVVLRGERDHHRRELRSLRLVDTGSTKWQAERLRKVSVEMHKKSSDMPQESRASATPHPAQIGYAKRSLEREVPSRTFGHPREFLLRGSRNINLAGGHQFRVRDLS